MTLQGLNLLLVEDDMLILQDLKMSMERQGARVETALSVADGLAATNREFDAAILDIRLGDGEVFPVAQKLKDNEVPVIFHSAISDTEVVSQEFPEAVALSKPIRETTLIETVIKVVKRN